MQIEAGRLAYSPFKSKLGGHVYVIFTMMNGEEIAISPEAHVLPGDNFSLWRGMVRTYRLRYHIVPPPNIEGELKAKGRDVHEYPLRMNNTELAALHDRMRERALQLEESSEWYNTLFNSCMTNLVRDLDTARSQRRSWLSLSRFALKPALVRNL